MTQRISILFLFILFSLNSLAQRRLKVSEIYDFDIGDEFHYKQEYDDVFNGSYFKIYSLVTIGKTISANGDTAVLTFKVNNYWFNSDTIEWYFVNFDSIQFNLDSGLYTCKDLHVDSVYVDSAINNRVGNKFKCIDYPEGCEERIYVEGIGEIYSESCSFPEIVRTWLLYYKKGQETWGEYQYIGISDPQKPKGLLDIFPNPSSGLFHLESNKKFDAILVMDVAGKFIARLSFSESGYYQFNAPKGIYLLQLENEGLVIDAGKIIIN